MRISTILRCRKVIHSEALFLCLGLCLTSGFGIAGLPQRTEFISSLRGSIGAKNSSVKIELPTRGSGCAHLFHHPGI